MKPTEHALYSDRTLLRILAMRRTVFVAPPEIAAILQAACSREVAAKERRNLEGMLSQDDPRLRTELVLAKGEALRGPPAGGEPRAVPARRRWPRRARAAARLVDVDTVPLGTDGPLGSRRAPVASPEEAEAELARRWLAAFGPATVGDLRWWTGWTATKTKRALSAVRPVEVDLDGVPGMVLAADAEPEPETEPWAALLPGLDPTVMGWTDREWYLGPHAPSLFDNSGNAAPTVWWNGRVVGGWAQRADGEVVHLLLEDPGTDAREAIARAAEDLRVSLGEVRLTARARRQSTVEQQLLA